LKEDRDALLTFYDLPADHWIQLRITNPIVNTFATVEFFPVHELNAGDLRSDNEVPFQELRNKPVIFAALSRYQATSPTCFYDL